MKSSSKALVLEQLRVVALQAAMFPTRNSEDTFTMLGTTTAQRASLKHMHGELLRTLRLLSAKWMSIWRYASEAAWCPRKCASSADPEQQTWVRYSKVLPSSSSSGQDCDMRPESSPVDSPRSV